MKQILALIGIILILNGEIYGLKNFQESTLPIDERFQVLVQNENIIKELEQKFHVYITYETTIFNLIDRKNFIGALEQNSVEEALNFLLKNSNLKYKKIRADYFVILENKISLGLDLQQDTSRLLKGIVTDEQNTALPGATVFFKETNNGTITDFDGKFAIEILPKSRTLVVSFIGYKSYEIKVEKDTFLSIHLEPETIALEEVVVAGVAGKTSVKKLTVTVAKVNASQLNDAPASSAATSLQGKVAGVKITQAYGTPGSGANIRLRGSTSIIGDQAPLILVDGNIFESSLADINVDDIESIEIVKGAAAASLYGSKAGSGVVLISTNRGNLKNDGKSTIKIRNEFGSSSISKYVKLAEHHPYELAADYANYSTFTKYEGVRYDETGNIERGSRRLDPDHFADNDYGFTIDNQEKFFNPGNYYTNYVSLANTSSKTNAFLSFENNKQSGILFATDGYKRQNFRVNIDHRISDKLKISTSNLLINANSDNPGSTNSFFDLLFLSPDVNLEQKNEDGSFYKIKPDPWSIEENPLYPLYYRDRTEAKISLLSNAIVSYAPVDWLNFDAKYSFEKQNKNWTTYTPRGYLYGGGSEIEGALYKEQYSSSFQTAQFTANFQKIYHWISTKAKLSYLYEDKNYFDFAVTGRDFITADVPQLNNTSAEKTSLNSYNGIIRAENIFGIVDFDIKDRYLFSALFRRDGSSLFGANERWNNYYRVSGAYRISQDIKIKGLDELKLRAAFGTAGQRPGFSYQYETWDIVNGALQKSTFGNKNLKPSESEEIELALDAEFLKLFTLQLSYSNTNTKDVFALAPLASHLGYPSQWKNVGTLTAWVYEASLGVKLVNQANFTWNINMAFDHIRQKITKLNIPEYKTGPQSAFLIKEGETLGAIYGYKWLTSLDEMQLQLQSGQTIDDYSLNSDGFVIKAGTEGTINEAPVLWDKDANGIPDLTKIGDGNPDFNLAFNSGLHYKNLQLYVLVDWKYGGDVYNYTHQYTFRDGRAAEFDQFGKPENEKKTIDYYANFYYHTALNSYFVEDGSYLKLREASVYYTLKTNKIEFIKNKLSEIKIGIIGHNIYTLSKYNGYDPEVASGSDLSNFPFDNFGYPNYRTFSASIEFKF